MENFTLGTFVATPEMRALVNQVLDSGRLSYGPLSREFEAKFAAAHGSTFGVLSNSGTSSLQVALQAMKELYGWADGDEVIVPALTFVATVNIVLHCKMIPVLVDVDPDYYDIDASKIAEAITPRTRCIIPVHPFGQGADMSRIMDIAQMRGLKVIEDSCEAMFVGIGPDKRPVGSWGHVGCFSMYVAHIITGGVGGIGITDDPELASKMRSLVNHGIDLDNLPSGDAYDPSFLARNFTFSSVGHSFRITELEAALLLPQLVHGKDIVAIRQAIALVLTLTLSKWEIAGHLQLPKTRNFNQHAFMVYPIVMLDASKHDIMDHLRRNGVEVRDMLPLTNQPCYNFDPSLYPVAYNINHRGFYIGCHQDIGMDQLVTLKLAFKWWFDDYAYLH